MTVAGKDRTPVLVDYLHQAHHAEQGLVGLLTRQVAGLPDGTTGGWLQRQVGRVPAPRPRRRDPAGAPRRDPRSIVGDHGGGAPVGRGRAGRVHHRGDREAGRGAPPTIRTDADRPREGAGGDRGRRARCTRRSTRSPAILVGMGLLDGAHAIRGDTAGADDQRREGRARTAKLAAELLAAPGRMIDTTRRTAGRVRDMARETRRAAGIAVAVATAARLPPRTPLLSAPSPRRAIAHRHLPMAQVLVARRAHGGTSHDLLLAVVTGALRDWHAARGMDPGFLACPGVGPGEPAGPHRHRRGGQINSPATCATCRSPKPIPPGPRVRAVVDRNKATGPHRGPGAVATLADHLPVGAHQLLTPLARRAAPGCSTSWSPPSRCRRGG
jgi:hypothetical protein